MASPIPTIKSSEDFQKIARLGKRYSTPAFFMQALPADHAAFRIGYTASRKVGGAVVRNRVKRRMREVVRLCDICRSAKGWDIVIILKTAAADYDFEKLREDFRRGLIALKVSA